MRFLLLALTFTATLNSFACTEAMKPFEFECKVQDRYSKLSQDFLNNKLVITNIKGFAIPRALGNATYFATKNDLLNHSETSLNQIKEWQAWKNGQKFLESFSPAFIDYNDILKIHKAMYAGSWDAGKIRTSFGQTNPKIHYGCNDKMITDEVAILFDQYDVKSVEGYSLLTLEKLSLCEDKKTYSGDLVFYKGASMKTELKSWVADFNDMLNRYSVESENEKTLNSPYAFLSDMKRWFLAIHPFTVGNEIIVNILMDYAAKKLALPPMVVTNSNSIFLNLDDNRVENLKLTQENLSFLENCLYETKVDLISPQCSSL